MENKGAVPTCNPVTRVLHIKFFLWRGEILYYTVYVCYFLAFSKSPEYFFLNYYKIIEMSSKAQIWVRWIMFLYKVLTFITMVILPRPSLTIFKTKQLPLFTNMVSINNNTDKSSKYLKLIKRQILMLSL